jgi:hypothetical protein
LQEGFYYLLKELWVTLVKVEIELMTGVLVVALVFFFLVHLRPLFDNHILQLKVRAIFIASVIFSLTQDFENGCHLLEIVYDLYLGGGYVRDHMSW